MITWKKNRYNLWGAYLDNKKVFVPSITAIINSMEDPELDDFVAKVGQEKADKIMKMAADRGTIMHLMLENYYLAKALKGNPKKALLYTQQKTVQQAKELEIADTSVNTGRKLFYQLKDSKMDEEIYKVLGLEKSVASFKWFFRGKYDISYLDPMGKRYITDFKAASSHVKQNSTKEKKYKLQLVGYWTAYEENTNKKLDYAKLWIGVKNLGNQEIKIDKKEKELLWPEFEELCINFHKENNQDIKELQQKPIKIEN